MLKFISNLCREAFRSVRERTRDSLFPKEAIAALTRTCFVFSRDPLPQEVLSMTSPARVLRR